MYNVSGAEKACFLTNEGITQHTVKTDCFSARSQNCIRICRSKRHAPTLRKENKKLAYFTSAS
jgi:hypothetical protein